MSKILRFLASLKLAVYIIAAMAGLCVVAALYGDDSIYSSWMLRLLMAAFWLNLFCCTVLHMPRVWRMFRKNTASVKAEAGFSELADTADISADTMQKKVKKLGLIISI